MGDPCYDCGTPSVFDDEGCYWHCPRCGVGVDQDGQTVLKNGTVGFTFSQRTKDFWWRLWLRMLRAIGLGDE
jgi:hypothetical protein